jgi:predicted DNA-binding WGR domain protein
MQLVQRTTLLCQDAKSDKIYEVDLVQVGDASYMVNFRYGKRGKALREGSETVAAVPEAEARKALDKLVASKIKKGYRDVSGQDLDNLTPDKAPITVAAPKQKAIDTSGRDQRILDRLQAEITALQAGAKIAVDKKTWKIDRVIWRSGELGLRAAAPLLMQLLTPEPMRRYCVLWAIGNCGDSSVVSALDAIYRDASEPEMVRRIALEAMFKLSEEKAVELRSELVESLPNTLKTAQTAEDFSQALQTVLADGHALDFVHLDRIYQINAPAMRPALLEVLRSAPFKPNYFQRLRHIFKAAEYRGDGEVFALLARRFEQEEAGYYASYYIPLPNGGYIQRQIYDQKTRQWQVNPEYAKAIAAADSPIAYSNATQAYFQRRPWRTLKTLGKLGHGDYTAIATEVLLTYSDDDAEAVQDTERTNWKDGYRTERSTWDQYASAMNLNHILYTHSPRYELKAGGTAWRCKRGYKPGNVVPNVREEAFPNLWTQAPESLLKLLLNSECKPVHEFATKAIQSCAEFCQNLNLETLLKLLAKPYEITAQLAFNLVREQYNPESPNFDLVLAIVNCEYGPARAEAYQWIQAQSEVFLSSVSFTTGLITSSQAETRSIARTLIASTRLSTETLSEILNAIVQLLLRFEEDSIAQEIAETLLLGFQSVLPTLDLLLVMALLDRTLPSLQQFAAQVLLRHNTAAIDLPDGLISRLLASELEAVRVVGVQLFSDLPDDRLVTQLPLIQTFLTHELPAMREAIRPRIAQLAQKHTIFRYELVAMLLGVLQHPEVDGSVQSFVVQLLHQDIPNWMETVEYSQAMNLLGTKSSAAQEMAGHIFVLNHEAWIDRFDMTDIVQFTHNEVKIVRTVAQSILQLKLPTIRSIPALLMGLVNILDSDWEDGRSIGITLFGEWLVPDELTPAILINICDSNRADVRKFGRDLVTTCFKTKDGLEYLSKLSEHPANDMQLFATQYLERYASNQPDRLRELMPYFTRVLGQVNRARVAKQRIFAFLDREASLSLAAAELVAELLTRQSAAIPIGDRSKSIEILLTIHKQYPQLSVPIALKPIATKPIATKAVRS